MTPKGTSMGLVFLLVATTLWIETMAQSSCTTALMGLAPCLNFISGNSSPSSSCCLQLSNVVQSQPQCLCSLLNGGGTNLGILINQTLALSLPSACKVQTPPFSRCNVGANVNGPTSSIADPPKRNSPSRNSPSISPDRIPKPPTGATTPMNSGTPPAGGSKSIPSKNSDASDGTVVRAPNHVLVCAFFAVSTYASIITNF